MDPVEGRGYVIAVCGYIWVTKWTKSLTKIIVIFVKYNYWGSDFWFMFSFKPVCQLQMLKEITK